MVPAVKAPVLCAKFSFEMMIVKSMYYTGWPLQSTVTIQQIYLRFKRRF